MRLTNLLAGASALAASAAPRRALYDPYRFVEGGPSSELFGDARAIGRSAAERTRPSTKRLRGFADSRPPRVQKRSPLIKAKGEVIGDIFDGDMHSLGGDYGSDPADNRSVAVSAAAVNEALSRVYGRGRIVREPNGR